jgi:hypothetical protein
LLVVVAGIAVVVAAFALGSPVSDRVVLLHNSVDLAMDYPFTGLGLSGFPMAYASYVQLTHVAAMVHSHNILLDLWLEQGLPGVLAFAFLLGAAFFRQSKRDSHRAGQTVRPSVGEAGAAHSIEPDWHWAAWVAIGVILIHGLVDDAFYGSRGVLLLFLPFSLLVRAWRENVPALAPTTYTDGRPAHRHWLAVHLVSIAVLVCSLAVFGAWALLPATRSAWLSNLGAVAQTRAELSQYHWPEWPIQDQLRRAPQIDLAPAIEDYQSALALAPDNASAARRLGQIELSRGEVAQACRLFWAAMAANPAQRATRQLVGECYALNGDTLRAAALWKGIDMSQGQAMARQWWYGYAGDASGALGIHQSAVLAGLE